jgi:AdoMet-dependent rRNA methyltransferase SPB1
VAKEQGFRSRAAFKLTQINRKFPYLEKCETAVLDLCAAPGGWTQVAARTCPKSASIVAVDILPVRKFKGFGNITTLIGDITTDKCKSDIKHAVAGKEVDLVLHDGAPNIGAEYGKDAYEQNELSLHALRCATQHLTKGGTFITKIYRSRDYAAFHWLLQQLFGTVSAFKPKASRQQSAEIFLVAENYKAPSKLDPRLLDPKHVFEAVDGQTDGTASALSVSVLSKKWDSQLKARRRNGYDMEHLDATMRHIEPIVNFVQADLREAVQFLSSSTGFRFTCSTCGVEDQAAADVPPPTALSCSCNFLLKHASTKPEIKECFSDLQVLNKSDFKALLNWRMKMQEALAQRQDGGDEDDGEKDGETATEKTGEDDDSDKEEEAVQAEILEMRQRRLREKKRKKKKEREAAAKRRRSAALGMDMNGIDNAEHDKLFSLASITNAGDLAAASEVNLDEVTDEQIFGDEEEDVVIGKPDPDDDDKSEEDPVERNERRADDLEEAYHTYLRNTKDGLAKSGTKMAKRSKKTQRLKMSEEAVEDEEMMLNGAAGIGEDTKAYVKLLQGDRGSDDDDDESSDEEGDDGFNAEPMTPKDHANLMAKRKTVTGKSNPLLHQFDEETTSARTARWFSNPIFESIAQSTETSPSKMDDDASESDASVASKDDESTTEAETSKGKTMASKKRKMIGLDADEVLESMPRTDKQIRHTRRLKSIARDERKKEKRARMLGETEPDFEITAEVTDKDGMDEKLMNMSESKRNMILDAREQIKKGLGKAVEDDGVDTGFRVVSEDDTRRSKRPVPVMDDRKYDSDHEDYDSEDYAETLALGTMMLRRSKEKSLVDASYNRYAWNDPGGMPEWFVDDEKKHYRPQLPIPQALVAKMKERMMALASKPIAKVAEARARKTRRAKTKLAAAKKQAESIANSSEISESMKLKAISKALRGQTAQKPGKTYVVAKKGRGGKAGGKGVKVVDKRMICDKRGLERAEKRKKGNGKRRKYK